LGVSAGIETLRVGRPKNYRIAKKGRPQLAEDSQESEGDLMRRIMKATSKAGARVFRNNVGKGWMGESIGPFKEERKITVYKGDVIIRHARRLRAGLFVGSADILGAVSIIITPEMVGQKIALPLSMEVKTTTGRMSRPQKLWCDMVNRMGGRAAIVRSVDDALALLGPSHPRTD